jgi:endonuclease/exonuclease/phosphatase (EEP) superfamily protein YafD
VTWLLAVLGLGCVVVTLLPLSRHEAWWVRAWDFPRLQIVAVSLVVLGALLATGDIGDWRYQLLALTLLGSIAYHLAVILPYTRLWPVEILPTREPPRSASLSLLVVNVLMSNRRSDRLLALVNEHAPDVVLALETDHWWCERFEQVAPSYPFRVVRPIDTTYGMLLYSRLELVEPELRYLIKPEVPSVRTGLRLRSGATVMLYGLHPEPPAPSEADTSLPRDAELVLVGREVAGADRPTIVAGDLNDVAWSHTSRLFRRISRLLDPRIGRGMFNSFHAEHRLLRWPLDHVFVSDDFLLRAIRRLPGFGSDHFPILIAIDHVPRAAALQEAPPPDADDHAEADDKLARAGMDPAVVSRVRA